MSSDKTDTTNAIEGNPGDFKFRKDKEVQVEPTPPHREPNRLLQFFTYDHLPPAFREVSKKCSELAHLMDGNLPDGPEKTVGLRKLLEAKDCFVRAALEKPNTESPSKKRVV